MDLSIYPDFKPELNDEEFCKSYESILNIGYEDLNLITKDEFHSLVSLKSHENPNVIGRLRLIHSKCKVLVLIYIRAYLFYVCSNGRAIY